MNTPFIFIGTHRIKAGKRDDFLRYFSDFCNNVVEPQEPRLHSFYGYTGPDTRTSSPSSRSTPTQSRW